MYVVDRAGRDVRARGRRRWMARPRVREPRCTAACARAERAAGDRGPPLGPIPPRHWRGRTSLPRREAALLAGYGWIDRAHGVTRIPIDEAMRSRHARGRRGRDARRRGAKAMTVRRVTCCARAWRCLLGGVRACRTRRMTSRRRRGVGFDQRLGATLPLDTPSSTSAGRSTMLWPCFGGHPVIVSGILRCPNLCDTVRTSLKASLERTEPRGRCRLHGDRGRHRFRGDAAIAPRDGRIRDARRPGASSRLAFPHGRAESIGR